MATDWLRQMQTGIDRWLDTQREWWNTLSGNVQGAAGAGQGELTDLQKRTIEAWRESANKVVDAQAELLFGALRGRSRSDAEALLRRWTDAQREMWEGWLGVLQQRTRSAPSGAPDLAAAGTQMVDSLRQAAEQLVRSQADWAKAWTASQEGGKQAPGAAATASPAAEPAPASGGAPKAAGAATPKKPAAKKPAAKEPAKASGTAAKKKPAAKKPAAKKPAAKKGTSRGATERRLGP